MELFDGLLSRRRNAAHSMGFGAVWPGVPVSIISIGMTIRQKAGMPDRFEEEKIRKNK